MFKKIYNIIFIICFLAILSAPLLFADWSSGEVSADENRYLADFPKVLVDGKFNNSFTTECESWFMDHIGFRQELISINASIKFHVFDQLMTSMDYYLGVNGDLNYATETMMWDYAHLNLRTEEEVAAIGQSYQTISDWLGERGIQFYYVQCYDKHTIYPEQFMDTIVQNGNVSKTDQVVSYLEEHTTVDTISLKNMLLDNKSQYETYSNWGDPTHWTERGAYLGYKYIMSAINANNNNEFLILQEEDYEITVQDAGITLNNTIHKEDLLEHFVIKEPKAYAQERSVMGEWSSNELHNAWKNENASSDKKLLLLCDSYIDGFIDDDFAESFSEVWLIRADYTLYMEDIVDLYDPDIIIYECAERVDRSTRVCELADILNGN